MNDLIFNILKLVISVVMALVAYYVIPLLKEKVHEAKYAQLIDTVMIAVKAAEQSIKGSKMGPVKKEAVVEYVTEWINAKGIAITKKQLDELIEFCVFEINRSY